MKKHGFAIPESVSGVDIKRIRKILGCTQMEFAEYACVSPKTVERWESGKAPVSGPVVSLIRILEESPEWFDYYAVPEKQMPLRIRYMFRNRVCTVIDVDDRKRKVRIRNYTNKLQFRAFGRIEAPDYSQYEEFLESRCFPRGMDKEKLMLDELDIPFYDPFLIIEKTQGRMSEDEFWLAIER